MTAPVTTFAPATLRMSANALLTTAVSKVPAMFRGGASMALVEAHLLVAARLADDLYEEAAS